MTDKNARLKEEMMEPIPNVWGTALNEAQSLGPRLRGVTWQVRGRTVSLFDWLVGDNRQPQHLGRAAALRFISEQADRFAAYGPCITSDLTPTEISARALIGAAANMGTSTLRGAISKDTEAALRALLDEPAK